MNSFVTTTQPSQGNPNAPKAYINIVFLDEQFRFIDMDQNDPGVGTYSERVSSNNDPNAQFALITRKAPKNGWVFVYLSNQSNEPVYFDDFFVSQEHSRISEETHYYPFGLKIAGISSQAFNKNDSRYGYQGDYSEEESETGWNEFDLRMYDSQIGRWTGVDPYDEFPSPYLGMGNDPVNFVDQTGGGILDGTTLFEKTLVGAATGFIIGTAIGALIKDEKAFKYGAYGALIGGFGAYFGFSPLHPNFYIGPTWGMVKQDAGGNKIKDFLTSAYFGSYLKSMIMEFLSLGKVVTVRGASKTELNAKVNDYFDRHPGANTIGNATVEFHAGDYGEDVLSENSFDDIGHHFDENSTILMGNCFCGSKDYLDDISAMANGATVIGHYGYQNDFTFLVNGSLTGGNPNVMNTGGSSHLDDNMFVHRIAWRGKIINDQILLTTHVTNSGKITYRTLSANYVNKKTDFWKNMKSKFWIIFEAIFNPTK